MKCGGTVYLWQGKQAVLVRKTKHTLNIDDKRHLDHQKHQPLSGLEHATSPSIIFGLTTLAKLVCSIKALKNFCLLSDTIL